MSESTRILVVDDEPINIRILGELLAAEGYAVSVARDGQEALASIEREMPNLLLLDVVMPGLSGYEVCQRLRGEPQTRMLPIILVTGHRPE
ncbi:MAG: response regulator, partial [Nevskiales bacterium]